MSSQNTESPFGRLITAMVTPFDTNGNIDHIQVRTVAKHLIDTGTTSIVVTGTTGEGPSLSEEEKLNLYTTVLESINGSGKVIAGTTTYNTKESIALSVRAEDIGVDGILMTVPYYNKPTQSNLINHFEMIARSISIPGILYNVPSRTSLNMTAATTAKLSNITNIIGVKEASADLGQIADIIRLSNDGFFIWSGNDADTLPVLSIGGYGVVSVASHLVGKEISRMIKLFTENDLVQSAKIHRDLMPLIEAIFYSTSPIPLKYMLNKIGISVGNPRPPLGEADDATKAQADQILRSYNLIE
jgi:4-hydroxy-tetrahydrodipicolinate synthase